MKKVFLTAATALAAIAGANAQSVNQSAHEIVTLRLANVLVVNATQGAQSVAFNNAADYNNAAGLNTTGLTTMTVKSTRGFHVTAHSSTANFVTANGGDAHGKTIANVLSLHVAPNAGAGTAVNGYGMVASVPVYGPISTTPQNVLTGGSAGGNQQFSVGYNAQPNWGMAGGDYTATIVYTATQD